MAKRVFLHIGTMKSATTYIQEVCDLNRRALRDAGVFWSHSRDGFEAVDDLLGNTRHKTAPTAGSWAKLNRKIVAWEGDALVSNELLVPIAPAKMAALVDGLQPADVQVVVTARDLARVIPSQWQTGARNRATITWADFLRSVRAPVHPPGTEGARFWRKHDISGIVRRWNDHVPLENITVVTVPPSGSPPTLPQERFASVLGIDMSEFKQPPRSNPSLGAHSAELVRRLNSGSKHLDWRHYQLAYKNALSKRILAHRAKEEPVISLSSKDMKWLNKRTESHIKAIEKTGVRVVGDLQDLVPTVDAPRNPFDPGASSDAELLASAEAALLGLAELYADHRIEYNRLVNALMRTEEVDHESEEWQRFVEIDSAAGAEDDQAGSRRGRFLRWRGEEATGGDLDEDSEPVTSAD